MTAARLLVADRLIDGTGTDPIPDGGVLVEDETIVAVGVAARLRRAGLDEDVLAGATILPGLIDSHVHLELSAGADHALTRDTFEADRSAGRLVDRATANALAALAGGVTTLRDCGSTLAVLRMRDAFARGEPVGPRILVAGPPITTPCGHCHWWGGIATTHDEVLAQVRERAAAGADAVKIMTTGGIMTPGSDPDRLQYDPGTLAAATAEAHRLGLRVVVHALAAAAIDAADAAGVDSIDHAGWGTPDGGAAVDQAVVARVGRAGRAIGLTTSGIVRRELDRGADGAATLRERMLDKVILAAAGARIHVHSDAGVRFTPFDRPDLSLRAAAVGTGMSPVAAIRAMTSTAADMLGLTDVVGTLRPGRRADLLVVAGDPSRDLSAIRSVVGVWRDGRQVVGERIADRV